MISNYEEQAHAYKYLANYHLKNNQLEDAFTAAQKCTEFPEVLSPACLFWHVCSLDWFWSSSAWIIAI